MSSSDPLLTTGAIQLPKPGAKAASYGGRGIVEVRDVIQILETANIPCCVVGGYALVYYGARMVPNNWEICVPTDSFERASAMFIVTPLSETYEPWVKIQPQVGSLKHTYPQFRLKGVNFSFFIIPAFEYFIRCEPSNFEKSEREIPFPKLECFAQSLLDTQRYLDLTNLIDGMDLSEEWGEEHLNLDKPGEIEYAKEKNEKIVASLSEYPNSRPSRLRDTPMDLRQKWQTIVRTKQKRIGIEVPGHLYSTRFRIKGSPDPRLREERNI
ncbi:uncharacterized protein GGS22DRAFT_61133 [Annulohypoxylon maeteangense]|uniref:uncharacterized protein n=1 Tax=Annulohypoxylon maeteangense TaxID=1927788 RepID=UPI002008D975|nr:uncharacterized protein GGS22DRAFT_61133 [Annulohypoxylon maeteangense]KAI0888618.1 hypothetical protein GGS22DRAFT_61133 [Annulohypoxylon maeteangense]